jgi:hypothetical protein
MGRLARVLNLIFISRILLEMSLAKRWLIRLNGGVDSRGENGMPDTIESLPVGMVDFHARRIRESLSSVMNDSLQGSQISNPSKKRR